METEGTTQESPTGDGAVDVVVATDAAPEAAASNEEPPPPATATATATVDAAANGISRDGDEGVGAGGDVDVDVDVHDHPNKKVVPVVITVDTTSTSVAVAAGASNTNDANEDDDNGGRGDEDGVTDGLDNVQPAVQVGGGSPSKKSNSHSHNNAPSSASVAGEKTSHQARTPKHANRTEESKSWEERDVSTSAAASHHSHPYQHPGAPYHSNSFPPPHTSSRSAFDHRGGGGGSVSAFHPHDRQQQPQPHYQQQQRMPMQVSPGAGGGRYYQYNSNHAGPPPRFGHPTMPPFEPYHGPPQQHHHHPGFRPPPQPYGHGGGHGGPMSYPHPYEGGGGGYDGGPSWGRPPPPSYNTGPPPPPPPHHGPPPPPPVQHHDYRGGEVGVGGPPRNQAPQQQHPPILQANSSGNFSRAVSSSFDRSIKSTTNAGNEGGKQQPKENTATTQHQQHEHHHGHHPSNSMDPVVHHAADSGVGVDQHSGDDASWGQLNQVASVDEDELRKRLAKNTHHHRRHHHHDGRAETPEDRSNEVAVTRSASNSSSLTNSPTEGVKQQIQLHHQQQQLHHHHHEKDPAKTNKMMIQSSLDSLSSVASAQAPMDANNNKKANDLSPQGSTTSLDLMKCPSGSSALLLPRHESSSSHPFSYTTAGKRGRDGDDEEEEEGRGDDDTKMDASELRKAPSSEEYNQQQQGHGQYDHGRHHRTESGSSGAGILSGRPKKRTRTEDGKEPSKKSSPLSIECSPPNSPTLDKRKGESGKAKYLQHPPSSLDSYYDKPPQYSYSLESAPPMPLQNAPSLGRPESTSSTITPMQVEDPDVVIPPPHLHHHHGHHGPPPLPHYHHHHSQQQHLAHHPHHDGGSGRQQSSGPPPALGQIPSWEIHHQDSFGGGHSVSGGGGGHSGSGAIMQSFSFPTQEYPGLTATASTEQHEQHHGGGGGGRSGHHPHHPALESRNQSFDGGHYHGSFARSDSMMSYEHPGGGPPPGPPMYDRGGPGGGYHGPFPPQAASWGSASSYPQGHYYHGGFPGAGRNYSEDSSGRGPSPPPPGMRGHHGGHRGGGGFQPPPEFRAPPSMVPKAGPNQTQHILSSPYTPNNSNKGGSYGWSKEEDHRLTDIMKKYKNPRDWDPIAKEHNCGRSAKECHERWIRYLKPGVRKGQWTDHEDAIVMEVVSSSSEQPFTRWSDLAQRLPGRVGKQIRDRWVNHLNPNINHLPFSREDDLLLWDGHKKLGKRWVEISTKYFASNRSENHIKNRWYSASFKKFISNEFGLEAYSGNKMKKESPKKKNKDNNSGRLSSSSVGSPSKRTQPPADEEISQCEEV